MAATLLLPDEFRLISQRNSLYYVFIGTIFVVGYPFLYKRKYLLYLFILLLYVLDLGRYFQKYNTFFPSKLIFPTTPVIQYLTSQEKPFRIARQNTNLLPANSWSYYNLESVEGYDPLYPSDYGHFFHLIKKDPYESQVSRYATLEEIDTKLLSELNVKYFLALNIKNDDRYSIVQTLQKDNWTEVFSDKSVTIFQNPNVLPRAYVAKNPKHPVLIKKYSSQEIDLEITTATATSIIISNSFDPGWKVKINNTPGQVYKTNFSFLGVDVQPGTSQIQLYYLPDSFLRGTVLSLVSLLAILLSLLFV